MLISSKQIKGHGRGHKIGFPTINLVAPTDIVLDDGIYAVWVTIADKTYKGALHYGAVPTFGEINKSMEVHLLNITDIDVPNTLGVPIEIDIVTRLRDVRNFTNTEDLALQIDLDVKQVNSILK